MAEAARVPGVDDLRVKLCYICREEEQYDQPESQQNKSVWVHPCNCTLVAHESCLLEWIKTAQQNPARAENALKCPQCGAEYELESNNPPLLRLMEAVNKLLTMGGRIVMAVNLSTVLVAFGSGLYVVSTAYGLHAMQEFLGKEMFDHLITDDPGKWPLHAWFNLPMIPLTLILSRTSLTETTLTATIPLFITWAITKPVQTDGAPLFRPAPDTDYFPLAPNQEGFLSWPPGPVLSIFLWLGVKSLYRRCWNRFCHYVLDTQPARAPDGRRMRRFLWDFDEGGAGPLRLRIAANVLGERRREGQVQAGQQHADAQQRDGGNEDGDAEENDNQPTARYTSSSIGRLIGGALMIPTISNRMGTLLYRLSQHSSLLRKFLGVKPPMSVGLRITSAISPAFYKLTPAQQVTTFSWAVLRVIMHGTRSWNEMDPVWFRNTIGLGLFVVAKDCAELFYAWLSKRELESRHVKTRPFRGIDARELDLIRPQRITT
ncbi:hypothetical protein GLOTRDRAFT_76123 [Gloeophyllum trabeum ATCC 11539]|uniref:RING-CH-type domain-containing protein n=1 Tax=Gloeophyllum trabeum (strain ATCC 11539 / FP-39264 / Madison 617) TaxID=670483 RepID=S7Q8N4_GLOTA|nr:uncharacterized protein GLOTRDRAFT_76123 [Gloeophyllum trabeum ATCC 11539]EPQ55892.1 hypothetical protein GLOTRDRAFT_76123 [Gloeophyllum trabeum ATCC 11539]